MGKITGLVRKKSAYFYARRIPLDIRGSFDGKQQVSYALKTTDYRIAVERARRITAEVDQLFRDLRAGKGAPAKTGGAVSSELLRQIARRHLHTLEKRDAADDADADALEAMQSDFTHLSSPHEEEWSPAMQRLADSITAKMELPLKRGEKGWFELVSLLRRAEVEHLGRALERGDRNFRGAPHDQLFVDVFEHSQPPPLKKSVGVTVGQLIERFENDPTRAHLTESAGKKYILPFGALRAVVGDDAYVSNITRADCAKVHELLASLPPNYSKYKAYRGKGLAEIAEMARGDGLPSMSPGTVEVYAHHLSAFFNYAIQKGAVDTNPAARLSTGAHRSSSSRVPFNVEELNSLWSHLPEWSGSRNSGRFWTPLIGCWSGMRLGEIVWLSVADIQNVDGVDAFVLTSQEDRRLKTRGATRIVPVHKDLKRLGFMEHVDVARSQNRVRLFPDLPGENQAHTVDMFQKRFSYMLREKVEVRKGVSFHSFRHGFRDALREAGSPIDVTRALGGWGRSSSIEDRYGQGTRPKTLARWMDKIAFPGASVVHLLPS